MDELTRAWAEFEAENYSSAERAFQKILACPDLDEAQEQQAKFGLGYAVAFVGRFDEARIIYEQLRQRAKTQGDGAAEHRAIHQIGMVERMAGDWEAAQRCFELERMMIERQGSPDLAVAINAYELGLVNLHLGQAEVARQWFDLSLESAGRTDDLVAVGCAYRGIGDWHRAQGNFDAAIRAWAEARLAFDQANESKAVREIEQRLNALG